MSQAPVEQARPGRRRRVPKSVRFGISMLLVAIVLYVVLPPEVAGVRGALHLLAEVNIAYLLLGFGLEVLSLIAYARLTHTVLSPGAPPFGRLFRINMSSLAVSHVVPGGTAPGTGVAYRLLVASGVRGSDSAFGLALQGAGSAVVLNLIFWLALIISLFLNGDTNPLYLVAAVVGIVLLGAFGSIVLLLLRGRTWAVDAVRRLADRVPFVHGDAVANAVGRIADRLRELVAQPELLRRAVLWAAANWLFDAGSLWVFIFAFPGHKLVLPVDLLVAYGLANVLAALPLTPGGLGIVEGVLIPSLHGFGVPRAVATLGVLSYRLVNFWLPIPVGAGSYLSLKL
ncbi:MAG: lysylphosphatidylglycerol synthase transmembrane domain-containing protein [Acidimicrobiales bacterium]